MVTYISILDITVDHKMIVWYEGESNHLLFVINNRSITELPKINIMLLTINQNLNRVSHINISIALVQRMDIHR